MEKELEYISLFSGIGGFDLGFERAGMKCVLQAETDKFASQVLAHHWPHVKNVGDVRNAKEYTGAVDLICGGFPCQDLSVAGKRAGLDGERSGLWFAFRDVIERIRPQWVVIENVPGLLSSNGGRDMGTVIGSLADLGYGWAYRVLDSQYFGVAQRRRRVFIVGCLGSARRAAKVLFEPESCARDTPPGREAGKETSAYLTRSPYADNKSQHDELIVARCLTAREGNRQDGESTNLIAMNARQSWATPHENISPTLNPGGGGFQSPICFQQNTRDEVRYISGDGQIAGALASHPGAKQQNYISGVGVRRLTPLECERLQGFPDGWTAVDGIPSPCWLKAACGGE